MTEPTMTAEVDRQLVLVVEGTAALGQHWPKLLSVCIQKILSAFRGHDREGQKLSGANVEMGLVVFHTHGSYSPCSMQCFGWTKKVNYFMEWLSNINFNGGGTEDSNVAEGLAEALMVETQTTKTIQKHCVLVAASNPYLLPVVVPRPSCLILQNQNAELEKQPWVADVDKVAEAFTQCGVSLSVVSPRKIPKLISIFKAGNGYASVTIDAEAVDLVLLSQRFKDDCSTNPEPALESTATHSVSVPPTTRPSSDQTGDKIMSSPNTVSHAITMDMEVPSTASITSAPCLPTMSAAFFTNPEPASATHSVSAQPTARPSLDQTGDKIMHTPNTVSHAVTMDMVVPSMASMTSAPRFPTMSATFSTNPEPASATHSVSAQPIARPSSDQTGDKIMVEHHPMPNTVSRAVTMGMEVSSTVSMTSSPRFRTMSASFSTNPERASATRSVSVQQTGRDSSQQTGDKIMVEHPPTPNTVSRAATMDMVVPSTVSMTSAPLLSTVSAASLSHMTSQAITVSAASLSHMTLQAIPAQTSSPSGQSRGRKGKRQAITRSAASLSHMTSQAITVSAASLSPMTSQAMSGQISSPSGQSRGGKGKRQKVSSSSPHSNSRLSTVSTASLSQPISGQSSGDRRKNVSSSSAHSTRCKKRKVDAPDARTLKPLVNNTSHQFGTVTAPAQNVSVLNNPPQTRQVMSSAALPQTSTTFPMLQTTVNAPASMYISNIRSGMASTATSIGLDMRAGQRARNAAVDRFGSSANTGFTGGNAVTGLGQSVPGGAVARPERTQSEIGTNQSVPAALRHVGPSSLSSPNLRLPSATTVAQRPQATAQGNLQLPPTTTVAQQPVAATADWQLVWEGDLQYIKDRVYHICRLQVFSREGSRIVADWPSKLCIKTLMPRNPKVRDWKEKAEFLKIKTTPTPCQFFTKLKEKKHWILIELPTKILLISTSGEQEQFMGILFPSDIINYELQLPSQPQQQQQPQERQRQKTEGLPSTIAQNQFPDQNRPQVMSRGHKQQQRQHQDGQPQGISTAGLKFVECQFPDQRSQGIGQEVAYSQFPPHTGSQLMTASQQQHQFPQQLMYPGQQQQPHKFPPHNISQLMSPAQQQHKLPPHTISQQMPSGQQQQHHQFPDIRSQLIQNVQQKQQQHHQQPPPAPQHMISHGDHQEQQHDQQNLQGLRPPYMPNVQQHQQQEHHQFPLHMISQGGQQQQHHDQQNLDPQGLPPSYMSNVPPHMISQGGQQQQHNDQQNLQNLHPQGFPLYMSNVPPHMISQGGQQQQHHDQQNLHPRGFPPYMSNVPPHMISQGGQQQQHHDQQNLHPQGFPPYMSNVPPHMISQGGQQQQHHDQQNLHPQGFPPYMSNVPPHMISQGGQQQQHHDQQNLHPQGFPPSYMSNVPPHMISQGGQQQPQHDQQNLHPQGLPPSYMPNVHQQQQHHQFPPHMISQGGHQQQSHDQQNLQPQGLPAPPYNMPNVQPQQQQHQFPRHIISQGSHQQQPDDQQNPQPEGSPQPNMSHGQSRGQGPGRM